MSCTSGSMHFSYLSVHTNSATRIDSPMRMPNGLYIVLIIIINALLMSQIPLWSRADSLTVSVQPHASVQSHASTDTGSILSMTRWYKAALFGHIKLLHSL